MGLYYYFNTHPTDAIVLIVLILVWRTISNLIPRRTAA